MFLWTRHYVFIQFIFTGQSHAQVSWEKRAFDSSLAKVQRVFIKYTPTLISLFSFLLFKKQNMSRTHCPLVDRQIKSKLSQSHWGIPRLWGICRHVYLLSKKHLHFKWLCICSASYHNLELYFFWKWRWRGSYCRVMGYFFYLKWKRTNQNQSESVVVDSQWHTYILNCH